MSSKTLTVAIRHFATAALMAAATACGSEPVGTGESDIERLTPTNTASARAGLEKKSASDCKSPILNVGLPPTNYETNWFDYSSQGLGLDFLSVSPRAESGILCEYQSNIGTLLVALSYGTSFRYGARSTTQATLTVFEPGAAAVPVLQSWDFSEIFNNGRLLNGPFDPSHAFVRWESPGFSIGVDLLGGEVLPPPFLPDYRFPGPLVYWVDVTDLGSAPGSVPIQTIVRDAEAYLHQEMTRRVIVEFINAVTPLPSYCPRDKKPKGPQRARKGINCVELTVTSNTTSTGTGVVRGPNIDCNIDRVAAQGTCASTAKRGTQIQLTATPTNGSTFGGWTSACDIGGGASLTCTLELTASREVGVKFVAPDPVASVAVSPASVSLTTGQTTQLSVVIRDSKGVVVTRPVTWASTAPNVATVSSTGLVSAVAAGGPATITATVAEVVGSATVSVRDSCEEGKPTCVEELGGDSVRVTVVYSFLIGGAYTACDWEQYVDRTGAGNWERISVVGAETCGVAGPETGAVAPVTYSKVFHRVPGVAGNLAVLAIWANYFRYQSVYVYF